MIDINWVAANQSKYQKIINDRKLGDEFDLAKILDIHQEYKQKMQLVQDLQQKRNNIAKQVGMLKGKKADESEIAKVQEESSAVNNELENLSKQESELKEKLDYFLLRLPNVLDEEVPVGLSEDNNKEIKKYLEPKKYNFTPLPHFEIGEKLGEMSFEDAAKLSGSRFTVLYSELSRLERALINFMLDNNTKDFGYEECSVPFLVTEECFIGTGQLPRFEGDFFRTTNDLYLLPTAEVALTNLVRKEMILSTELPKRFTSATPCFRSEAGAAGKDTRGMFRQHQFMKVELVSVTMPEESKNEHERMLSCAESVLQKLELPYRVVVLCTGDMGPGSMKTYDIEVWLPGQDKYREISSCSNVGEYQARRMMARYKTPTSEKGYVHTLNGSSLAIGRTIIAILENYQNGDGTVSVPEKLQPYMDGKKVIGGRK